jgi:hypothetical protein
VNGSADVARVSEIVPPLVRLVPTGIAGSFELVTRVRPW